MNWDALVQGFFLGGSLIIAIGAQNAFILSQSLRKNHEWVIASICALCDILLIFSGIAGLGTILALMPSATQWIAGFGILFLLVYGLLAFKSMLSRHRLDIHERSPLSLSKAISITLALTLLNPHVYLDTVMLIGSVANTKFPHAQWYFATGATIASLVWFYGLTAFAKVLAPLFKKPITWRVLDGVIGIVMWSLAFSLIRFIY